jgi:hypothetical protein
MLYIAVLKYLATKDCFRQNSFSPNYEKKISSKLEVALNVMSQKT